MSYSFGFLLAAANAQAGKLQDTKHLYYLQDVDILPMPDGTANDGLVDIRKRKDHGRSKR